MLRPAHTPSTRVIDNPNQWEPAQVSWLLADEERWVCRPRLPAPGALTLGVFPSDGGHHKGLPARMPGSREAVGQRRCATVGKASYGARKACFQTSYLSAHPKQHCQTSSLLCAHGFSKAPLTHRHERPASSFSRFISVPRPILGGSWFPISTLNFSSCSP